MTLRYPLADDVNLQGRKLENLADPTDPQDAATRAFVLANSGSGIDVLQDDPPIAEQTEGTVWYNLRVSELRYIDSSGAVSVINNRILTDEVQRRIATQRLQDHEGIDDSDPFATVTEGTDVPTALVSFQYISLSCWNVCTFCDCCKRV